MNSKEKVLFIVLPYYEYIFEKSTVKEAVSPATITLGLATVAAPLVKNGYEVRILDLNLKKNPEKELIGELENYKPKYIGISVTTPTFCIAKKIAKLIKDIYSNSLIIGGGPHVSVLPDEVLKESDFDIVIRGEGDLTLLDILEGIKFEDIPGISYKKDSKIYSNKQRPLINDLDSLPYPTLNLFDIRKYRHPKVVAKMNPVASIETSRGCYGKCTFCNKSIFQSKFRTKSPDRVVDEMRYALSLGFREIHIVDDVFTANINRAKIICEKIIKQGLNISWYPRGGVRVDRVDQELLFLMKTAGVWQIPFGIESGNQDVLNKIKKEITLEQIRKAIDMARIAKIETVGYFMFGLPGDTEESIKETIKFSTSLKLDHAKYAITLPLPGTPLFNEWDKKGYIKTRDWSKYTFSTPTKEIYNHPGVSWKVIDKSYRIAPRKFYLRPNYIIKRFINDLGNGELISDIKTFLKIRW